MRDRVTASPAVHCIPRLAGASSAICNEQSVVSDMGLVLF